MSDDRDEDRDEAGPESDDTPAVLSPGDSDAPDAPDSETVYPDKPRG